MSRRARGLLLFPVLLAAVAGYWPALRGDLQYDDEHAIAQNLAIKDLGRFVRERFLPALLRDGRPLTDLTFAVNHHFTGLDVRALHLTNLLIHLCAVALAFAAARLAFSRTGAPRPSGPALVTAAIFALHPLQSEAVSYLCQRAESLASALYLAALLALLKAAGSRRGGATAGWSGAALLLHAAALAAKPMAATLPAAFLLFTIAFPPSGERRRPLLRAVVLSVPLFALSALSAWLNLRQFGGREDVGFDIPRLPASAYLLTQPHAILAYLRLFVWPTGLSVDHDFPVTARLDAPTVLATCALLGLLLLGVVLVVIGRRAPAGKSRSAALSSGFGILFFFLCLLPTSSFIPLADVMVEHRVYLALFGIALAAVGVGDALLAFAFGDRATGGAWVVALSACAALGAGLYQRNHVWRSYESLWADVAAKAPRKARAHFNYGQGLFLAGKYDEAIAQYDLALGLAADGTAEPIEIYRNEAAAYVRAGRPAAAVRVLELGRALRPLDPDLLNNLAICQLDLGHPNLAAEDARLALSIQPDHGGALNTLGEALLGLGDPGAALRLFRAALFQDPDSAPRLFNVAATLERLGDREACLYWARYGSAPEGDPAEAKTHLARMACARSP